MSPELSSVVGKRKLLIPPGKSEAAVVKAYAKAYETAEKLLKEAAILLHVPALLD